MTYGVMGLGSADLMAQAFRVGRNMGQQGSRGTASAGASRRMPGLIAGMQQGRAKNAPQQNRATPVPPQQTVTQVGPAAAQDPILGAASLLASKILVMYAGLSPRKRIAAVRKKLNEMHPGLGNKAISKTRELQRKGRGLNQAIFDGVRLAIANRFAEHTAAQMAVTSKPLSGLGALGRAKTENIQAGFCAAIGIGTAGGGMYSAFKNPTSTEGVLASGAAGAQIAGCTPGALSQQANLTQQQLDAAAASSSAAESDSGMPWLWIGLGLVAVAGIGLVVVKSR